jgi:hypothetical protein
VFKYKRWDRILISFSVSNIYFYKNSNLIRNYFYNTLSQKFWEANYNCDIGDTSSVDFYIDDFRIDFFRNANIINTV